MKQRHNKKEPVVDNRHLQSVPSRTLDPPFSLVDRAREIENAEGSIQSHVNGKLDLIVNQIRMLKEEARSILEQAERDLELHRAKCNFEKRAGQTIHLYQKGEDEFYFSLLSPEEWGGTPPHPFAGSYRMNGDRSFDRVDDGSPGGDADQL